MAWPKSLYSARERLRMPALLDRLAAAFDRCAPGGEAQLPYVTLTLASGACLTGHVLAADMDTVTLARTERAGDWREQITLIATVSIEAITAPYGLWLPASKTAPAPPSNLEWKRALADFQTRFGSQLQAEPASHLFVTALTAALLQLAEQDAEASALLKKHVSAIALRPGAKLAAALGHSVLTIDYPEAAGGFGRSQVAELCSAILAVLP